MKKWAAMFGALLGLSMCFAGCGHTHVYTQKATDEEFLKSAATCTTEAEYYYSCECGKKGKETFLDGESLWHDYTAQVATAQYLKEEKTCQKGAEYYYSCVRCGAVGRRTFTLEGLDNHVFDQELPTYPYLKTEATLTTREEYYKSCKCGAKGTDTFFHGEILREYTEEEKLLYTPTSITVTLFDTEKGVYGFTYNTQVKPLRPVIQVATGEAFETYQEYSAAVEEASSYDEAGAEFTYYIVKAEVPLQAKTTYYYRAYDKYVKVGAPIAKLTTKDMQAAFTFAHVSDSQGDPKQFSKVLQHLVGTTDFLVHTGDVVESSKEEAQWQGMLHGNATYLTQIPVMAISGNHETTYKNGSNETFKHFHHNIPAQSSTNLGYFYSFVYGNTKFIMLNTNDLEGSRLKDEQYNWLLKELENNDCTWTIVSMHNPMYSVGKYGSDSTRNGICLGLRGQLQGIFAQYGVDVVLQGHDHAISRTYPIDATGLAQTETWQTVDGIAYSVDPNGVLYVMNGPAGEQARDMFSGADTSMYHYAQASKACSWAEFSIDGNTLTVRVKYSDGTQAHTYHAWGITKS